MSQYLCTVRSSREHTWRTGLIGAAAPILGYVACHYGLQPWLVLLACCLLSVLNQAAGSADNPVICPDCRKKVAESQIHAGWCPYCAANAGVSMPKKYGGPPSSVKSSPQCLAGNEGGESSTQAGLGSKTNPS